jgi:hypothetical protein
MSDVLWRQLGAAIGMLEDAITACPDALWSDRGRQPNTRMQDIEPVRWIGRTSHPLADEAAA